MKRLRLNSREVKAVIAVLGLAIAVVATVAISYSGRGVTVESSATPPLPETAAKPGDSAITITPATPGTEKTATKRRTRSAGNAQKRRTRPVADKPSPYERPVEPIR